MSNLKAVCKPCPVDHFCPGQTPSLPLLRDAGQTHYPRTRCIVLTQRIRLSTSALVKPPIHKRDALYRHSPYYGLTSTDIADGATRPSTPRAMSVTGVPRYLPTHFLCYLPTHLLCYLPTRFVCDVRYGCPVWVLSAYALATRLLTQRMGLLAYTLARLCPVPG